ncbi:MAG: hypothetical protein AB9907_13035 [Flexilinea sp.]
MDSDINPEDLTAEVLKGKNFRGMDILLTEQLVQREIRLSNNRKEIIKNVKSKLYQVSAAFRDEKKDYRNSLESLKSIIGQDDNDTLKAKCIVLMKGHASTRERLPILNSFYEQIFSQLPTISSVLDLACGLNPLAIPWMPLNEGFSYEACDLYEDMVSLLNGFFDALRIRGSAKQINLLDNYPDSQAELTLLLKTIPCLEQIDKKAGKKILTQIKSDFAVISFPAHSLSGRNKGMPQNYESHFLEICNPDFWEINKLAFSTELAFILKRK